MNTVGDALNVMRSLLGTAERPAGSNRAEPVTRWYGMEGPWCAMTVSYALVKSGHPPHVRFAWCPTGVAKFKSGQWGSFHQQPQPGDLVFYSFGGKRPDHVGMVESVTADGSFITIEGNVGDRCKRLRKTLRSPGLLGFGRPRYGAERTPRTPEARRTLALGASGEDVRGLQHILVGAGLLPAAEVDGAYGKDTRDAVVELQRVLRVVADGVVGPVTHAAIDSLLRLLAVAAGQAALPKPRRDDLPVLRRRDRGDLVTLVQTRLRGHGFDPGRIDGVFGDDTETAVEQFQRARGLEVDGEVGPFTWGALG